MQKKLSWILVVSMILAMMTVGCGSSSSSTSSSSSKSASKSSAASSGGTEKQKGDTFTVGFDAEFPPYGFKDDSGNYVGFDLDLAEEVCSRNGWKLVKQPIDWDSKDMELESGTIDCIWNGFTITGRESDYTWSDPYLNNYQVVIVNKSSGITKLSDLSGKTVLVQADSSALKALSDGGDQAKLATTFAALTQIPDYNTAFMNLEAGAADAVALDYAVAQGYINSNPNFVMLDEKISTEQYAVGFKLGNTALRDQVQKTLDEMASDGTVKKIADKYEADYGIADSLIIGK